MCGPADDRNISCSMDWSGIQAVRGRKYRMTIGASWSRPKEHEMPWWQDQTSTLVIGVSTVSGSATAAHLPWKLGGTGDSRSQLAKLSIEILLLGLFSTKQMPIVFARRGVHPTSRS